MLLDIIELKQAALWHGGDIRIDHASEAAAEDMVRQPKTHRISFRTEGDQIIVRHSSRAHKITADFTFCFLRIIVVRACVAATVRRDLREPVAPVEKVSRRKGNFPLASILVTDIPRRYSF